VNGAVPPVGVKSIVPVADPHCESPNKNSPLTPALTVIEGNFPHFGEISLGLIGQAPLGVVHASQRLAIFTTSPQV
jgi:hypothetical protein